MRDRRHIESGVAGKSFLIALLFLALVACSTKSSTKPPETTTMQPQQKVAAAKDKPRRQPPTPVLVWMHTARGKPRPRVL